MRRFRTAPALLVALILPFAAYPQTVPDGRIERGIRLFGEEKYSEALELFNRVLADPAAQTDRPDAVYWSGLSYMALGDAVNARRTLDTFLKEYPRHPSVPDALYQRARVAYTSGEYEESILLFSTFLEKYPDHSFASSALFWTADGLFSLGRLAESETLFRTLLADYPKSVKFEAASYKLALIRYKYRENELLTLLKWSHEESLRVIEEFQRREKAYEQALAVYQRRLADTGASLAVPAPAAAPADSDQRIAALNARIEELTKALAAQAPSPSADKSAELLALKAETLELLSLYIDWLAGNVEKGARP
ncbi:MAG TPA: tetratricopeptide repeat protein [Spirochaetia bacterium]|nr:tetratricopeptide repeat protein [Spirochaetales bacterium]HRY80231.1 tetratricopeptide repeat protein [Spirochaetia bacterium]